MTNTNYNGWTNLETWQAALWLGECMLQGDNTKEVSAEDIKDWLTGLLSLDSLSAWTSSVNWREIEEAFNEIVLEG